MTRTEGGFMRRAIERLGASRDELDAAELQRDCIQVGATPIGDLPDRRQVTVAGTLRTVTLRPVGGVPALEAELWDGSGAVSLIWLGRRRLAAIEPGRALVATGLVCEQDGRRVIFNPRYELRPAGPL
jgi:hypothetical protein